MMGVPPSGSGCQPSASAAAASSQSGIPNANEPEWLNLARETVLAIAFQRATRGVHVIGKDGRSRFGCVDLLGCYAVDEMARAWAAYLGLSDVPTIPAPDETQAMHLLASGGTWRNWVASAIEAPPGGETANAGSTEGESAAPSGETPPSHPLPSKATGTKDQANG